MWRAGFKTLQRTEAKHHREPRNKSTDSLNINSLKHLMKIGNWKLKIVILALLLFSWSEYTHAAVTGLTRPSNYLGLVGHWTFDGKDTPGRALDVSGQANHGNLVSMSTSTSRVPGKIGQGLKFDGVNDEINLDNLTNFDFSQENQFTISTWLFPGGSNASDNIFTRGSAFDSADDVVYYLAILNTDATRWTTRVSDGTNQITVNGAIGTVSVNQWQHITTVWNGTTLNLYKNGTLLTSGTGTFTGLWDGNQDADREMSIGAEGRSEDQYWNGKIDDVRIYNRALSAGEITQLYNVGQAKIAKPQSPAPCGSGAPLSCGLVGHWTFDGKDTPGRANDISGQGNHGNLVAMSTSTSRVAGKLGQAFKFDWVNDLVNGGSATVLDDLPALTVSVWVKANTNATKNIIAKSSGSSAAWQLSLVTTGIGAINF